MKYIKWKCRKCSKENKHKYYNKKEIFHCTFCGAQKNIKTTKTGYKIEEENA